MPLVCAPACVDYHDHQPPFSRTVHALALAVSSYLPFMRLQVHQGPGTAPEPSSCFSDAALDQVKAAVKEWKDLGCSNAGGTSKQQPSLVAIPLEHR
jgi:hypothetical protein